MNQIAELGACALELQETRLKLRQAEHLVDRQHVTIKKQLTYIKVLQNQVARLTSEVGHLHAVNGQVTTND